MKNREKTFKKLVDVYRVFAHRLVVMKNTIMKIPALNDPQHSVGQVSEYETFHSETGQYCHPCGYLTSYFRKTKGTWLVTEWAADFSPEEQTRIVKFVQTHNV